MAVQFHIKELCKPADIPLNGIACHARDLTDLFLAGPLRKIPQDLT